METQQSGHAPRSGPEVKNGRNGAGEAEGVRRRCMKNSPSVLSCIGKRTKEGCVHGSEVETVHSG